MSGPRAAGFSVAGDWHLRKVCCGQRREPCGSAAARSTDLGQRLQVMEHQVRQTAHVIVHVTLGQMRQESVVLRMNACHAAPSRTVTL